MASTLEMEYQVFLCIFQKNSVMATLSLKEMRKFLWEGREKSLPLPMDVSIDGRRTLFHFFLYLKLVEISKKCFSII